MSREARNIGECFWLFSECYKFPSAYISQQCTIVQANTLFLHRNTPVSARTWFMPSNAAHATRSIPEKLVDHGLGDRFSQNLRSTRLPDSDLPVGRRFASPGQTTQNMLVSVIRSGFWGMIFRHSTIQPGGLIVDFGFI